MDREQEELRQQRTRGNAERSFQSIEDGGVPRDERGVSPDNVNVTHKRHSCKRGNQPNGDCAAYSCTVTLIDG
jgi:hypothetical protein